MLASPDRLLQRGFGSHYCKDGLGYLSSDARSILGTLGLLWLWGSADHHLYCDPPRVSFRRGDVVWTTRDRTKDVRNTQVCSSFRLTLLSPSGPVFKMTSPLSDVVPTTCEGKPSPVVRNLHPSQRGCQSVKPFPAPVRTFPKCVLIKWS